LRTVVPSANWPAGRLEGRDSRRAEVRNSCRAKGRIKLLAVRRLRARWLSSCQPRSRGRPAISSCIAIQLRRDRWDFIARSQMTASSKPPAFIFDLDGTLVDSVYQHVLAWQEALERSGIELSVWRIHRRIGMSGGLLIDALLREIGRRFTKQEAENLAQLHEEAYARLRPQVRVLPGTLDLLACLSSSGVPYAIATSGRAASA